MALTWKDQLEKKIIEAFGKKKGQLLDKKYHHAFSLGYSDENSPETAFNDVIYLEQLSEKKPLALFFYATPEKEHPLHLRLYQWQRAIPLSDILPMLENMDLRTDSERPNKIQISPHQCAWISDFSVTYNNAAFNIEEVKELFQEAFNKVYFGLAENDGFNKLVLCAQLSWREIMILRSYAKYLRQVNFRFTQPYIEKALTNNASITRDLVQLFLTLHQPKAEKLKPKMIEIEEKILAALNNVASLDEDKILRRLLELIKATLRTNYFQTNAHGEFKEYFSIKLASKNIPELPLPTPLYETFFYSPTFEAIHLRNAKVARGGIRWSERREDFRTEILGLMKAQVVKNAVIIPSGAKGGFVLKTTPGTKEALHEEVIRCYKLFIGGLLDITDNIIENVKTHPKNVVCYDDFDPYLVVAADKGTATFSDIANELSKEHDFWLGDAFASGGKTGYDHKKMGITARGAWESIKRHFRELSIDVNITDITVVAIGDMSGDVFGNGMLYSRHIKLVAAFDHRHIFIDPTPEPDVSYDERARLFALPSSSWEDYNPHLISKGGGVFKRSVKSITLSDEIKIALGISDTSLAPNDLIKAILKAPVELLYNGGIGTYVKASTQSQADVGDRTNDYCRVNGNELRCKVVGEGGNLGFTQLGRIEYAKIGGLINTDFIDNSGGVDCSDHEVNLKILLDSEVHKHRISHKKRNEILASLTHEVASLVLEDNYNQALVMSFSAYSAKRVLGLHINYIKELHTQGILNRHVEYLPDDRELLERKAISEGLTRPELAILLAYTKIHVKQELLKSDLPEDPYLSQIVETAFPISLRAKFKHAMHEHRLHRNIIATELSNQVINEMGITFVYRLQMETGAEIADIIRANMVASHIFGTQELQKLIESLDFKIPLHEQYDMMFNLRNLINLATRWFLHGTHLKEDLNKLIEHFSVRVKTLEEITPTLMAGFTKDYLESLTEKFFKAGLSKETAKRIATYRAIYTSLNIIDIATKNGFDLIKTAKVYFAAGERVNLLWFRDQIATDSREGHWNTLARLTLRDELDIAQRALTVSIISNDLKESSTVRLIEKWTAHNKRALDRWDRILTMLHTSSNIEYTMFFVAMRELIDMIVTTQPGFSN